MIVVLESPYKGNVSYDNMSDEEAYQFGKNIDYSTQCLKHSLLQGESPMAPHLLYTLCLGDRIPEMRKLGIEAGHKFIDVCDYMVVYCDHGISEGMKQGISKAEKLGKHIEYRRIYSE